MLKRLMKYTMLACVVLNMGFVVINASHGRIEWAAFNAVMAAVCQIGYFHVEE